MEPTQPSEHQAPKAAPYPAQAQPVDPAARARVNKLKFRWGLVALIAPTALLIISMIAYAIINYAISTTATSSSMASGTTLANPSPLVTIINIILYLAAAVGMLTWLPGIITGIVLLATRKR